MWFFFFLWRFSLPVPAGIIHIYIRVIISPHKITGEPYLTVFKAYKFNPNYVYIMCNSTSTWSVVIPHKRSIFWLMYYCFTVHRLQQKYQVSLFLKALSVRGFNNVVSHFKVLSLFFNELTHFCLLSYLSPLRVQANLRANSCHWSPFIRRGNTDKQKSLHLTLTQCSKHFDTRVLDHALN